MQSVHYTLASAYASSVSLLMFYVSLAHSVSAHSELPNKALFMLAENTDA